MLSTNILNLTTNNYLLVKFLEAADQTQGGILLPDKVQGKPQYGSVLAVGEGLSDMNGKVHRPDFEVGDLIYFEKHAPMKLDFTLDSCGVLYVISEADVRVKVKILADGDIEILPMGNYLYIEPIIEEEGQTKTLGGIYLPEQIVEKPTRAIVKAVGPGQKTAGGYFAPPIIPGEVVRYRQHSTFSVKFDDIGIDKKEALIIPYGDILFREVANYQSIIKERIEELKESYDFSNGVRGKHYKDCLS